MISGIGRRRLGQRGADDFVVAVDLAGEVGVEVFDAGVDRRHELGEFVRRELDRAVHAVLHRVGVGEALRHDQDGVFAVLLLEDLAPAADGFGRIGDQGRAVDHQQRAAVDADVARVLEVTDELGGHVLVVVGSVILRDQHFAFGAVPAPGPVFVRPHQAERDVDGAVGEEAFERAFQQALSVEPVVVEDEAMDAGGAGHRGLLAHGFDAVEVVEAEVAWDARLVMAFEARNAARDVGPFGEAFAPPRIVLLDGVELGQVIGEHLELMGGGWRQWPEVLELRAGLGEAFYFAPDGHLVIRHAADDAGFVLVHQVMQERVGVGVAAQVALDVELDVEVRRWVAVFAVAVAEEVVERIDPCGRDVGVFFQVECDIEIRDGAEPAGEPVGQVMRERAVIGPDVVGLAVPGRVELPGRTAGFFVAVHRIMQQWLLLGVPDIVIGIQIP